MVFSHHSIEENKHWEAIDKSELRGPSAGGNVKWCRRYGNKPALYSSKSWIQNYHECNTPDSGSRDSNKLSFTKFPGSKRWGSQVSTRGWTDKQDMAVTAAECHWVLRGRGSWHLLQHDGPGGLSAWCSKDTFAMTPWDEIPRGVRVLETGSRWWGQGLGGRV